MARFKRRKDGRFEAKSGEDRKVRSIRATDSAWESFGDLAEAQNMTRADLIEQLVEDGKLDVIQGLELLQTLATTLRDDESYLQLEESNGLPTGPELRSLDELTRQLEPIRALVAQLEPLQELAETLEPVQELAQKLEPMKELAATLEPIQTLAQQLEPIAHVERVQSLGQHVTVLKQVMQQVEALGLQTRESKAPAAAAAPSHAQGAASSHDVGLSQRDLAIALAVVQQFMTEQACNNALPLSASDSVASMSEASGGGPDETTWGDRPTPLHEFQRWLLDKLQGS